MSSKVQLGTVKWFNELRGYGFIIGDHQPGDVLAHYSRIEGTGFKNLVEGQRVRYTEETTPKGRMATWIAPVVRQEELPMLGQSNLAAL